MSAIAGILAEDVAALTPVLEVLERGLRRRGHAHPTRFAGERVALSHVALREGAAERGAQAEVWRTPGLLLTWDGRLDNADELKATLGARQAADLELLALAYGRWGLDCLRRVVGDFALALWDRRERRLVLARDAMGARPLFWARRGEALVWASTLQAVRAATGAAAEIDERWLAGYFIDRMPPESTPLRAVHAVPAGKALVAEGGQVRRHVFWDAEQRAAELRGSLPALDDAGHEERFRELFLEAVRVRLRPGEPAFADLSGGLDSSSIVCAADALLREGRAQATELVTVSQAYELSASADEREWQAAVERRVGRPALVIGEAQAPFFEGFEQADYDHPMTHACQQAREHALLTAMRTSGARVHLGGYGGDHLLFSTYPAWLPLSERLYERDLVAFGRELSAWHAAERTPYPRLIGASLIALLAPRRAGSGSRHAPPLAAWTTADFARRTDLHELSRGRLLAAGGGSPARRRQVTAVRGAINVVSWLHDSGPWPIERSFPFLHRPLVEYCLAAPTSQFLRPSETRSLHRRALRGLLPQVVCERRDKRGPDEAVLRAVAQHWRPLAALFEDSRLERAGILDPRPLRRSLEAVRFGQPDEDLLALLRLIAVEVWLRSLDHPAAEATPASAAG